MERVEQQIDYLWEALQHPEVSGFEMLEFLDVRSKLAIQEPLLSQNERSRVEAIDRQFLRSAPVWLERIRDVSDLAEMREKARVLPSHWWWYLDEITQEVAEACAGVT
jgi:hypothetical protein